MGTISIRELVDRYDQELVRLRYKSNTLNNYRVFWKQLLRYFDSKEQSIFSEVTALHFLDDRYNLSERLKKGPLTRNEQYVRQMVRKLAHFQLFGEIGRPNRVPLLSIRSEDFANLLGHYAQFCLDQRYAQSTRRNMRGYAVGFFKFLESSSISQISQMSSETIVRYVNTLQVHSYHSVGLVLTCLRSLFQFLHANGYHHQDLSEAAPSSAGTRRKLGTVYLDT